MRTREKRPVIIFNRAALPKFRKKHAPRQLMALQFGSNFELGRHGVIPDLVLEGERHV